MGINIGAFLCNFVAAIVRNSFDERPLSITARWELGGWHAAFATAAIGMLLGLCIFGLNYTRFAQADARPTPTGDQESLAPLFWQCLLPAGALGAGGWFLARHVEIGLNAPTAAFIGACLPAILFYLSIWRRVPDPADRGRVGALLVIFGVVIVFWMTMMLSSTALVVWARDNTHREPNTAVRVVTDAMPEFAENAPPSYFTNAGPEVARPARASFEVVSTERYKELREQKKLNVKEGETVYVTQEMLDKVEAKTGPDTPRLPAGKQLKLVNPELFSSINPGYVVLFTPLVVALFHFLRRRGLEPSTSAKIGVGIFLTAGGAVVMLGATLSTADGASKGSPGWLFGTYALFTLGEVCLSPMGLSLVNKMSPANIRAFMMGGWFLATSFGNKLSGIFGEAYQKMNHVHFWAVLIGCNVLFAVVVFALLPWLERQMVERSS
jgi:POT family proton-dependent oligopeptide transporter